MASKPSKWATADEEDDDVAAAAQRKKERAERRKLKQQGQQATQSPDPVEDGEERPSKRRRTSLDEANGTPATHVKNKDSNEEGAHLLRFPNRPFSACCHVNQFELLNNIEEGSYGLVSRARRKSSGTLVALKKLKMEHTTEGFPVTGLREIETLRASRHVNVVELQEVVMGNTLKE